MTESRQPDPTRGLNTKDLTEQASECLRKLYNGELDAEGQRYASHILAERIRRSDNTLKAVMQVEAQETVRK